MTFRLSIFLLALLAGCCPPAPSHVYAEISQRTFTVERIVDGDTFKVTYDGESTSVRIVGINAPGGVVTGHGRYSTVASSSSTDSKISFSPGAGLSDLTRAAKDCGQLPW